MAVRKFPKKQLKDIWEIPRLSPEVFKAEERALRAKRDALVGIALAHRSKIEKRDLVPKPIKAKNKAAPNVFKRAKFRFKRAIFGPNPEMRSQATKEKYETLDQLRMLALLQNIINRVYGFYRYDGKISKSNVVVFKRLLINFKKVTLAKRNIATRYRDFGKRTPSIPAIRRAHFKLMCFAKNLDATNKVVKDGMRASAAADQLYWPITRKFGVTVPISIFDNAKATQDLLKAQRLDYTTLRLRRFIKSGEIEKKSSAIPGLKVSKSKKYRKKVINLRDDARRPSKPAVISYPKFTHRRAVIKSGELRKKLDRNRRRPKKNKKFPFGRQQVMSRKFSLKGVSRADRKQYFKNRQQLLVINKKKAALARKKSGKAHSSTRRTSALLKGSGFISRVAARAPSSRYWSLVKNFFSGTRLSFLQAPFSTVLPFLPRRFGWVNYGRLWRAGWLRTSRTAIIAGGSPFIGPSTLFKHYRPAMFPDNRVISALNMGLALRPGELTSKHVAQLVHLRAPKILTKFKKSQTPLKAAVTKKTLTRRSSMRRWLGIRRSFEPFLPRKSIVEMNLRAGHRLANYDRPDDPLDFRTHGIESNFVRSFIYNKKDVNKVLVHDRNIARAKFDKIPQKFFFYNHNLDPLYGSFILNKVINAVSSKGKKKYIRNLFYNIISENRPDLSAAVIGFIIQSLKPSFLNVPVRRGKETYNAPIPASDLKATVKAIHFFVRGVYSHRYLDTLEEKIATEILDYLYWWGYSNMWYDDHVRESEKNMHMRHYRSRAKY